jgi:hypothetical protein
MNALPCNQRAGEFIAKEHTDEVDAMKSQRAERAIENGQIVYSGREQRGAIIKSSRAYIAYDQKGRKIGKKYPTAAEAMRAVLSAPASALR